MSNVNTKAVSVANKPGGILLAALLLVMTLMLAMPALSSAAKYITADQAKAIALKDAGLSENQVTIVKLARYDKRFTEIYDIIFLTGTNKYTYHINAQSGEVLAHYLNWIGNDKDKYQGPSAVETPPPPVNQPQAANYISTDQAKAIALEHAGVTQQQISEFELKFKPKHGYAIYDIEFRQGWGEYEYEIDAATGAIISWEYERD